MTTRPTWLPDAAIGAAVTFFGAWEIIGRHDESLGGFTFDWNLLFLVLGFATAAGLYRLAPGVALALVWAIGGFQLLTGSMLLYTELAVVFVAFGTARYGSALVAWLSGLSIPAGTLLATSFYVANGFSIDSRFTLPAWQALRDMGFASRIAVLLVGLLVLAVPWLAGLVFRTREQALRSRRLEMEAVASRQQAVEIATLREQQTRMAHDVHDVVGHSLAVILAQAESAQFLPDDDPARLKETMANIATSARQSLRDVRQVLSASDSPAGHDGGLDKLIEGVQGVRSTVVGSPRPLPPEIESVAYRALQEMLTNAIKHGVPGEPVTVVRHWSDQLTVSVENRAAGPDGEGGLGLAGMRVRVESVGGRVDVRREGDTFTATAWIPVRHAS